MPWARISPDKLINLPLFGIDVIQVEEEFIWMRGPRGRMRVHKLMPRVFFEDVSDAHQAGATSILISSEAEKEELEQLIAKKAPAVSQDDDPAE